MFYLPNTFIVQRIYTLYHLDVSEILFKVALSTTNRCI